MGVARCPEAEADWVGYIASTVQQAIDRGELAGVEADQLAFEIEALGEAVIPQSRLLDRDLVYARARRAVLDRLRALATNPGLLPAE